MTTLNRNFVVKNGLEVAATANVGTTLGVTGATTLANTLAVTGNTTLSNTLTVTGLASFNGGAALGDATTDQIAITGVVNTDIIPSATGSKSLGNTSTRWLNVFANNLTLTTNVSAAGASLTTITASGAATFNGGVTLGDAAADQIAINGVVNTNIVPSATASKDLGNTSTRWSTVWANNLTVTTNVSAVGITATDMTLSGNLTVSGTTTYINTVDLNVGDNIIVLNADLTGVTAPTENSGFTVNRGSSSNVSFLWDESVDRWTLSNTSITGTLEVSSAVNTASYTIGSNFIANTAGLYHTGTMNAASYTIGSNYSVSSVLLNHSGTVNAAALSVGSSFIANSLGAYHTGTVNATSVTATSFLAGNSTSNVAISGGTITINGTNVNTAITSNASAAYTNAVSAATTLAGTAYTNATAYADTKAATAYSNATTYADTKAATAYSNATAYADTKAATAYSNATTFAANATNISSGTLADARLTANVLLVSDSKTLSGNLVVSGTYFNPASNTVLLGNTTQRWVINANTGNFTGTVTGVDVNMSAAVNAAALSVGSSFIANTIGLYHTGTVNAASHTTSGVTANATGVYPASNTTGTALGSATSRWAVTANTGDFSGPVTLSANVTGADAVMTRMNFKDTAWQWYDSGANNALDFTNGSTQRWAPTASSNPTLTISNWPASGTLGEVLIEAVSLSAAGTISLNAASTWSILKSDGSYSNTFSGSGVTFTSGTDWILLWSRNAGANVYLKVMR